MMKQPFFVWEARKRSLLLIILIEKMRRAVYNYFMHLLYVNYIVIWRERFSKKRVYYTTYILKAVKWSLKN